MELLQAGVDCSVIALWLGHELIETTQTYLHAHLALKEAALAPADMAAWLTDVLRSLIVGPSSLPDNIISRTNKAMWGRRNAYSASLTADGAYDGDSDYDGVAERHPDASLIIPQRVTVVFNKTVGTDRDCHLTDIARHGRMEWQRRSGYTRRSMVATGMHRYTTIVGRRLHAQTLPNQRTEAKIRCTQRAGHRPDLLKGQSRGSCNQQSLMHQRPS